MTGSKQLLGVAIAAVIGAGISVGASLMMQHSVKPPSLNEISAPELPADCNVYNINIDGDLVESRSEIPTSDMLLPNDGSDNVLTPDYAVGSDIAYYLDDAKNQDQIKAILLDVNSGGGDPVAAEEIGEAMRATGKPVVAVIKTQGDSAAYMLSSYADRIFASLYSDVGSIGVTASFLNESQKDAQDGIVYEQLSSGPFKDLYSPDKPLTAADKGLILRDVNLAKEDFVDLVAGNRHLATSTVEAMADGSSELGQAALQDGLVDQIGGDQDALTYLSDKIGTQAEECF